MVVHMRHTRSHTGNRRSHHALKEPRFSVCANCGEKHIRHQVCAHCGQYKGRQVIDIAARTARKAERVERKRRELGEEKKANEAAEKKASAGEEKVAAPLDAETLSKK
ncbi:50S ribosomal protein L32 [Candidatus Wolfebacteria bacterium]|nr:50S ribosomal protein L32 [Candidatus Wolfebacteria bacterium]